MIKKHKFFLIFFVLIVLLLLASGPVFALEVNAYPRIPGYITPSADCTGDDCLSIYIAYWFGLLVYIAGAIAAISFAIGAIRLMMSAENPEAANDAKDRMKGSILGLVLTLSAFIILKTINPSLITPSLTPLPGVAGIFYTNGSENKPTPIAEANTSNIPTGYETIIYKCSEQGPGTGPPLLIWKFPKTNFEGNDENYGGVVIVRKNCGEPEPLGGTGSFRMAFETSGVYYCLGGCDGDTCSGYMSEANMASGQLSEPFKDRTKSIMIVNDIASDVRYGAIFHDGDDTTRGGFCSLVLLDRNINKQRTCLGGITVSSSADIFIWNGENPETSGDGIEFYSEPFGWNSGAEAGKNFLNKQTIGNYWDDDTKNLIFDKTNVKRPSGYWDQGEIPGILTFRDLPGSIRVKGSYLVVLTNNSLFGHNQYCQTFYKDVPNLNEMEFIAAENKVDIVDVVPIK